jgi:hypothetical protein
MTDTLLKLKTAELETLTKINVLARDGSLENEVKEFVNTSVFFFFFFFSIFFLKSGNEYVSGTLLLLLSFPSFPH